MIYGVFTPSPERNLSRYLREIRQFRMLSEEEERALARRWRDGQDIDAAHRLVTAHLRLVAKIAIGYRGYGLPVGELINEGSVGMIEAVKRFDPDRGFRLSTYATWWVRAAMQEFILRSWSLVRIGTTAAQKKLFFTTVADGSFMSGRIRTCLVGRRVALRGWPRGPAVRLTSDQVDDAFGFA